MATLQRCDGRVEGTPAARRERCVRVADGRECAIGRGGTIETGTLLERESESRALAGLIDGAQGGAGSTVLLEGEAGLGKTALLSSAAGLGESAGMRVLSARGGELEREFPYGVVRQLFERTLAAAAPAQRQQWLAGAARFSAAAVAPGSEPPPAGDDVGESVLHGLYWLCANLAAEQPVLLAIDDAHWADGASLGYLSYLGRRVAELPLLIACAYRPNEGDASRLSDTIASIPVGAVLRPAPLSEPATAQLIDELLVAGSSAEFVRACHVATGGNPFLLQELVRALDADARSAGEAVTAERVYRIVPGGIKRSTLARLRRLGDQATQLSFAVAVLGTNAELRHAAKLAGLSPVAAREAADALAMAGILRTGRPLEFAHPVVRTTIYEEIAPARRADGHKRAAALLEAEETSAAEVAPHLVATEPDGDDWVVDGLRNAAAVVGARGAIEAAGSYLRRALIEPPSEAARQPVLLELGIMEARAGDETAAEHLREAHALARDDAGKAIVALELARALTFGGDIRAAVDLLSSTLDRIGPEHPLVAEIEGTLFITAGLVPSLLPVVRPRLASATSAWYAGDRDLNPVVVSVLATGAITRGRAGDAARMALHALSAGDLVVTQTSESASVYFATCSLAASDGIPAALEHLDAAVAEARSRGSRRGFATASCFRAHTRYRAGDVRGAEGDALAAQLVGQEPGLRVLDPVLAATLSDCRLERQDFSGADQAVASVDRARLDHDSSFAALFHESAGRLRLAQQRPREALEEIASCSAWAERGGVVRPAWVSWRSLSALAHQSAGDSERAGRLAAEELAEARAFEGHRPLCIARRRTGQLAGAADAVELQREAVAAGAESDAVLEHARALTELGAALRRAGHPKQARQPLREGLDLAHRCGSSLLLARAREELVTAGGRPRRIPLTGRESLTASELRVARRAAEGMANREIAQELFVTVRTVEGHLTHAYQKLGVQTREELPDALI